MAGVKLIGEASDKCGLPCGSCRLPHAVPRALPARACTTPSITWWPTASSTPPRGHDDRLAWLADDTPPVLNREW